MKRVIETIIVFTVWLVSASLAEAINVTVAEVQNGLAVLAGNKAPKGAAITWENDSAGLTTKGGSFSFTGVVPADCNGALSIVGADTINVALANCTPVSGAPAPVPQTGQTESYATGDDGASRTGVALPSPRFTDNLHGTLTDNLTGLIWLKNAHCSLSTGIINWATALTYVASLNTDGTMNGFDCGDTSNSGSHQTDWRLPNVRELFSLVNFAFKIPALSNAEGTGVATSSDPFTNLQGPSFWSSTSSQVGGPSNIAWVLSSSDGAVVPVGKDSNGEVLAVRSR